MSVRVRWCWLVLLLALAGCTGATGSPSLRPSTVLASNASVASASGGAPPAGSVTPSTSTPLPSAVTAAWTTTGLVPLSAPVAAGGSFVLYARRGTQLVLVGLDPGTGKIRWEQKAATGVQASGTMSADVSDSRVAYLRSDPADPLRSTIVVADGATGADLLRTAPDFNYAVFATCSGPDTRACVAGNAPRSTASGPSSGFR